MEVSEDNPWKAVWGLEWTMAAGRQLLDPGGLVRGCLPSPMLDDLVVISILIWSVFTRPNCPIQCCKGDRDGWVDMMRMGNPEDRKQEQLFWGVDCFEIDRGKREGGWPWWSVACWQKVKGRFEGDSARVTKLAHQVLRYIQRFHFYLTEASVDWWMFMMIDSVGCDYHWPLNIDSKTGLVKSSYSFQHEQNTTDHQSSKVQD